MLANHDAAATLAVKDLNRAKAFYTDVLGLEVIDAEGEEVLTFRTGRTRAFVYRSEFAGTNKATAATWVVPDVAATAQALKGKGVTFERYDMPGLKLEGDVYVGGGMSVAWFKDPDGNIHSIVSE